jgi:(E)-4-hydroxy-3-methylbut-2-enyl-diphosphate synthase
VRINPGNYVDKKKFEQKEYTEEEYSAEIDRIRERFVPLVTICKQHGTAMRIGTNHGSLSDRIMSRFGDTAIGMVESAMEFLRIARAEDYHNIVLSMKSSNPLVMVQAYRLLVSHMIQEFGECYPLHLGVTEAGDGEDGRIKSAIGIGTLLEDGIGDTIRVSLTEDPEFEIPVCRDIVKRYSDRVSILSGEQKISLPYDPFSFRRRETDPVRNIGGKQVPVVIADYMLQKQIRPSDLDSAGYHYDAGLDKWNISDVAADFIYSGKKIPDFELPGTLAVLCDQDVWLSVKQKHDLFPLFTVDQFSKTAEKSSVLNIVSVNVDEPSQADRAAGFKDDTIVFAVYSNKPNALQQVRSFMMRLMAEKNSRPVIIASESRHNTADEQLIHFSVNTGGLFLDGMGDGIWLMNDPSALSNVPMKGRTYLPVKDNIQFINNTSFSILQAVRFRISKTEYISCPSCGRTLFDLQETTSRIRQVTNHLKGLKIAIMGCIVNGPGEMADADFGYVGSGPGKITLYRGKEVVRKNIDTAVAVDELIALLKENNVWVDADTSLH